ncbi:50S ribosomal protein L17 [Sedimentisphaera salicampi]|uniref:Large ribosomal subunit protein bL17 n=1 Tax=Sedimentisphaera salicampi TaxID=1941349 RepID=A0A1W6LPF5_9BACT|nr:50S ribosomal protein L17 [Sedimentisphaera salicampi]OXU14240.1 50S ribosomal protein L17 [Sedimentisphaera salicampi]
MRHRVAGRHLGRTCQHRTAMRRNMASSLFEHGRICTTLEKAKEVKPFAEKLITLAKKGDLASRRRAISLLGDRNIFEEKDGVNQRVGTVVGRLFSDIGPKFIDRPGGYTRIIKLAKRRLGDSGSLCYLQLVEEELEFKEKKSAPKKSQPQQAEPQMQAQAVEAETPTAEELAEDQQADTSEQAEEESKEDKS